MLSSSEREKVGSNLVAIVKDILRKNNLAVKVEGIGGTKLRTMILNIDEGKIKIS